jgi:shikimate kinase
MTRPLLLNGFMATGKSTVGRRVAELEGVPFDDLDVAIERRAGARVSEIFESVGEAGFRRLERAELERVLAEPTRRVIALGGGALLSRDLRLDALDRACVVCLDAPLDVVLSRAGATPRPLLAGPDPRARAAELLAARRPAYAEAHARVDTGRGDVDESARAVQAAWNRRAIAVAAGERSYAIEVGSADSGF